MAGPANAAAAPALQVKGISKAFQGVLALDDVDLELRRGEVHALLGQNGSGKSTLIKILAGYHRAEGGGEAWVDGEPFELGSAHDARAKGIRFIHQDLALIDDLDTVDNLALGARYEGRWWLSDRRERAAAKEFLSRYELDFDVSIPIRELSPAQQSIVAIMRAIKDRGDSGGLLVLDEPTARLAAPEVALLFELIGTVRREGGTVLYVTHRLGEVFEIADRVSVLRDGRHVATCATAELDHDKLVELIIGRALEALYPQPPAPRSTVALELRGLTGAGVDDVSLSVHAGEIVGVTGLVGSGYEELLELIFGARRRRAGEVFVEGREVAAANPHSAVGDGIAFAPADRKRLGGMLDWTLRENVTLPKVPSGAGWWMSPRAEGRDARVWLERLHVTPADPERPFGTLSGGNQQRTILARWLRCGAKVLLLDEPTSGVDMGARHAIYEALSETAAEGTAILMAGSDVEEICSACDRVIVMRDGRIGSVLEGSNRQVERVLAECMRGTDEPSSREGVANV